MGPLRLEENRDMLLLTHIDRSRSLREMGDLKQPVTRAAGAHQSPGAASLQVGLHLFRVRALRLVTFPLANGIGVLHHQLIHPCQGLGEQHGPLKEAQVAPVQGQHKHHVLPFLCRRKAAE